MPATGPSLSWQHFPAGEHGFFRAPVLIHGASEAVLIDGGFTYPDGSAVALAIQATGKKLTTIYVSQSDPDYYFNLRSITQACPGARVLAASATVAAIQRSVEKKIAVWGPQLKENGPQSLADIVMPEVFDGTALTVDGETIEIVNAEGLENRRYLWVPSLQAIFGGVLVFGGVHVWTADTPTLAARQAWIRCLDAMAARHPATVVPGHLADGTPLDASAIAYTRAYLAGFEAELARSADSAHLITAMTTRYPSAGMNVALDIGSKVAKGEMQWG